MPKRLGYRAALDWILSNDDTEWLDNGDPASVTACLVADLFGKDQDTVVADLKKRQDRFDIIVGGDSAEPNDW